jgi:hypothetical protein
MATNQGNGDYLDVVAFIDTGAPDANGERKRAPRRYGYAKKVGDKLYIHLEALPLPGNGWDSTLTVEKRRERDEQQSQAPQTSQRQRSRS